MDVPDERARKLLRRVGDRARVYSHEPSTPLSPIQPGWLVCYRDRGGALCGGCDDRPHGTVQECRWDGRGWTVHLSNGQRLPLSIIRSVGRTDSMGQIVSAWTVKEHGYDGAGPAHGPLERKDGR